ncbi:MAG: hypothetical protein SW127_10145 [Actinomycetota bacterium]|nr:hypothetical protein [Actinomycetota bacterium]
MSSNEAADLTVVVVGATGNVGTSVAEYCDARPVPVSPRLVEVGLGAASRAHLVPATAGLFDELRTRVGGTDS